MKQIVKIKQLLSLIFFIGLSIIGIAQTLNPSSISTNGSVNTIVQDSTTIYLGGNFSAAGYKATGIAKINSNALSAIDFPSVQGQCFALVSDGTGGWYVGGSFTYQGLSNLIHILANNTIDVSFAPNPNSTVNALYLDGTTLYVGGSFSQISSQTQSFLAAIDVTTGVLQNWNPNPDQVVSSITKDANIVYVGGSFQNIGGRASRYFAAVDATTALSNPSISASSTVNTIEQDATNIYLGGNFSGATGYYTGSTSLLSSASDFPDFNFPIINGTIYESIPDGNGGWYVGGSFSVQGLSNLVHILANNTIDVSFAPNPNSTVLALYLDGTTLYVGGDFSQISSQTQSYIAAIDVSISLLQNWNPNPDGVVYSITKDANIVYVGGGFQNIGGRKSRNIAAVDATTALANPFIAASATVTSIEQDATNLYLGGSFSGANGYYTGATSLLSSASDFPDFNFPIINGSIYKSIPDGTGGWYVGGSFSVQGLSNLVHILANNTIDVSFAPNPNSTVNALYFDGTTLYVGGAFSQISSQTQSFLAAIDVTTGLLQNWNPNPDGGINSIIKDANIVYVGGGFLNIGGRECRNIAAVDATTALSNPFISTNSTINSLEQDATNLYLCGNFSGATGYYTGSSSLLSTTSDFPDFNFPKINGTINKGIPDGSGGWYVGGAFSVEGLSNLIHILANNTIDVSFAPNPNSTINALYLDGTTLYVGGSFSQISSQAQSFLAAIDASTGVLLNWNPNPDGGIYSITKNGTDFFIGGSYTNIGGQNRNYLSAIDAATGLATSWNPSANSTVTVLEIYGTDIIAGGSFSIIGGQNRNFLAAISLSTGNVTTWNPNPNGQIYALELNGTNAYVGGSFNNIGGQPRNYIAEISLSTGNATSWNPNANSIVSAVKLIGTTIYAGGSFTTIGGQSRNYLAALNNTNGNATTWNPIPSGTISTISANGTSIFTGGSYQYLKTSNRNYLMAIAKSNGQITTWDPNPNSPVNVLELNGTNAYAGGSFNNIGGQPRNYIAEISLSTGNATTWNPNANTTVSSIKLIGTTIFAGGNFTTIGGQTRNYLAALNNTNGNATSWNPVPNGTISTISVNGTSVFTGGSYQYLKTANRNYLMAIAKSNGQITAWDPNPSSPVNVLELNGTNAYVGGSFSSIGGQQRNYIAEISLTTGNATTWNPNANNAVNAIKLIGTTIYAGGSFTTIGGQSRNYLAALNNTNGNASTWNPRPNGTISTISVNGTSVFTGGSYQYLKTSNRNFLMAIAKSDGQITAWDPNPNSPVNVLELNGTNAYAGGSFTAIGGQQRNYIAEISLLTGNATTWNPNSNSPVNAVKLIGTTIYAGGSFTTIGGQSRNYFAALNNTNGNATTWNPKPDGVVYKILQANTDVVAIGTFTFMNSEQRSNLMAISKSTGLIKSWSPNPNSTVETIEMNGANAYIGGSFGNIGGQPRNYIAEISLSTGNATTWNPNANSTVNSIKRFGTTVFVGGSFTTIGGQSRNYLASVNNSTGSATTWNPNANSSINKLSVSDSVLYVAGDFTTINNQTRNHLSSFTLPNGSITAWNPDVSGSVYAMELTGSNVYVGGSFNDISGFPRNNLAAISKGLGNVSNWNPNVNGPVNSIYVNGNVVFTGGSFNIAGGQTCSNFAMFNANSAIPSLFFPQFNNSIKCFSGADSTLYVGGSFNNINEISYSGLASINYSNLSFEPSVDYFTPNEGGNGGNITISVYGNGFIDGTTFQLRKQGEPTINVQNTTIINTDGIRLDGIIDLHNPVALGSWDLVIMVPGYSDIILPNSFEVQQGIAANVWSEINGFDVIRPGIWQTYSVIVGNSGNIDARGVPLNIAIDNDVEVDQLFNILVYDSTLSSLVVVDTLNHPIPIDTLFGEPFSGKVYKFFISTIAPNASEVFNFKLKSQNAFDVNIWTDPPLYGSPLNPTFIDCAGSVLDLAFDFIGTFGTVGAAASCVYDITKASFDPIIDLVSLVSGNDVETKRTTDYHRAIIKAVGGCAIGLGNPLTRADKFAKKVWEVGDAGVDGYDIGKNCANIYKKKVDKRKRVNPVNSFDPNDKIGPIGGGVNNSINSNDPLPYMIRFENSSNATAAAQTVLIVDSLDTSVYDLSTFKLGSISVGEKMIQVPNGLSNYETIIDLRPSNNLLLKINAGLDISNGVVKWLFESLDPDNQMPTENPLLGFLPPNLNAPEGDGAVLFTINALSNIPENASISNKAYIYFDLNPAIVTNDWTNSVDNIKPISSVSILNDTTTGAFVNVNWSGSDNGSGISSFDVYKSVNNGVFTKWLNNTTLTNADFYGLPDSTYSFFTIAIDSAGNKEDMKSVAEATTSFQVGINDNLQIENTQVSIYPNPNQGNFNLEITNSKSGIFLVSIMDVLGRVIYSQNQSLTQGNNILPLSIEQTGIYFLTIGNEKNRIVRRVVINK